MDERFIRKQIRTILVEREILRYDKKIITSIRGRPPAGMSQRSKLDPTGLLEALSITEAEGDTMLDKIESILEQGTGSVDEMEDAFGSINKIENGPRKGVLVSAGDISASQGARFIKEILLAARNAMLLPMSEDIRVDVIPSGIIVYPSKNGREKWFDKVE